MPTSTHRRFTGNRRPTATASILPLSATAPHPTCDCPSSGAGLLACLPPPSHFPFNPTPSVDPLTPAAILALSATAPYLAPAAIPAPPATTHHLTQVVNAARDTWNPEKNPNRETNLQLVEKTSHFQPNLRSLFASLSLSGGLLSPSFAHLRPLPPARGVSHV